MDPTIVIADDHPLILKGLEDFLNEKSYNIKATAKNGKEAWALITAHEPDVAILDINMPFLTGLEIAEKCKNAQLKTKIVIITLSKDEKLYVEAKSRGICGYILKEFALEEVENCIASVVEGTPYFSPELIAYIEIEKTPQNLSRLTKTELLILKLITQNKTAKEIAEKLFISPRTVEKHKSNIIRKLEIERITNCLLIWAKENQNYLV